MHHFPAMQNEEYFYSQAGEWSLLSFLEWKKAEGIEIQGKEMEHANYRKFFKGCQERRQQRELENSRYQCRLLMRHVFIKLNWCAYAERKEERAGAKLLVTGGKQGASSKKCNKN